MRLGKNFVQWYLNSLCYHSVDSIIIHEERVGGNLERYMICLRCSRRMDITDHLIDKYAEHVDYKKKINKIYYRAKDEHEEF